MNFDEVWGRVCNATNWRKYGEMADYLKIKSPTISGAKNRGTFPIEWAFKIAQGFNLSTDWLLTGKASGCVVSQEIDEEFFIRVAMIVESILKEKQIELGLWPKLRLYTVIYDSYIETRAIDSDMTKKIISLAAQGAFVVNEDETIEGLVWDLAKRDEKSAEDRVQLIDFWWTALFKEFKITNLLAPHSKRSELISWLEGKVEEKT